MRTLLVLVLMLLFQLGFTQSLTDTLYFGNKKFPLQKTKLNYDSWQPGIVDLPSEYKPLKKELKISYNLFSDTSYVFGKDKYGVYMVAISENRCLKEDHLFNLFNFMDTIKVNTKNLKNLKPYIMSNHKKIFFSSISLLHNLKDTLITYTASHVSKGEVFSFLDLFDSLYYYQKWKNSTFIITDLYYQRGITTYYFDRNFIILCE